MQNPSSPQSIAAAGVPVTTLGEFRRLRELGGVMVVTGRRENTVTAHAWSCRYLSEPSFITKVVTNGGRNGTYHWFPYFDRARELPGVRPCRSCVDELLAWS